MTHLFSTGKTVFIPIIIAVGGMLSMSSIAYLLEHEMIPLLVISRHKIVNVTVTMQIMVLPISFMALGLVYLCERKGFKTFFRLGIVSSEGNRWNFYGPVVSVSFTLGTIGLMAVGVSSQHGRIDASFFSLLPLVLLISSANAWSEEIFSRLVIVAGLFGKVRPDAICLISAIIFGVPHFLGTPSGLFGVITSGFLGWLLAKSVIETRGMGWALLIHVLQDIVIFGAGAMIIAGQSNDAI